MSRNDYGASRILWPVASSIRGYVTELSHFGEQSLRVPIVYVKLTSWMSIETINISEIGWQWVRAYKVLLSVFQSSQARYLHSICGERSREWSGLLWRLRPEISLPIRERSQSRI